MAESAETSEWLISSLISFKLSLSLLNPNKSSHPCYGVFQHRQQCADPSLGKGALNFPHDSFTSVLPGWLLIRRRTLWQRWYFVGSALGFRVSFFMTFTSVSGCRISESSGESSSPFLWDPSSEFLDTQLGQLSVMARPWQWAEASKASSEQNC